MLITTTENIPGKEYEIIGLVTGNSVQAVNIGKDIGSTFRNIVGGEMKSYTELMTQTRDKALSLMTEQAQHLGADAVVCMRFVTASITQASSEVLAYGTAVKFK